MRTTRSSGRLHQVPPLSRHPQDQTPPGADPPPDQTPPGPDTSGTRPPREQTPPVNRMTDACENITLPQLRCGR